MIQISNLTYSYTPGKVMRFPDLKVEKKGQCLLLGESGSGKTTLLHLMGGLLKSQQGTILINDTNISALSESSLDKFRGRHIGFIFQKNHLISALTVKNNLLMAPLLAGVEQDVSRVEEVLSQLRISEKINSPINQLSQGQAQRVAIARAVLNRPDIILADEPTSALDDKNCESVINLLLGVAAQNQSMLIIATHDQRLKNKIQNQVLL